MKESREVAILFKKEQFYFAASSTGYVNKEQFEEDLAKNPLTRDLSINYNFKGFINAGTQAFDVGVDIYFLSR